MERQISLISCQQRCQRILKCMFKSTLPSQPKQAGELVRLWDLPSTPRRWGTRPVRRRCRSADQRPKWTVGSFFFLAYIGNLCLIFRRHITWIHFGLKKTFGPKYWTHETTNKEMRTKIWWPWRPPPPSWGPPHGKLHSFFHGGGVLILTLSIHPCNRRVNSDTHPPHRTPKVCNTGPGVCNFHYTS